MEPFKTEKGDFLGDRNEHTESFFHIRKHDEKIFLNLTIKNRILFIPIS